jgi:hypothetical protein
VAHRPTPVHPALLHVPAEHAVVGWRLWGFYRTGDDIRLCSPFRGTPWSVGAAFEAECFGARLVAPRRRRRPHKAPGEHCRCGVHACTYPVLRDFLRGTALRPSRPAVIGRTLLWGAVVAEGFAWRGEYGYPERLIVPTLAPDAPRAAESLRAYDVPVTLLDVAGTYTALHALDDVRAPV